MKTGIFAIIFLARLLIQFLHSENKKKAATIKLKMQKKKEIAKKIKTIRESPYNNHKVACHLVTMLEEFELHNDVNPNLTDTELLELESKLNLTFPLSYKLFLKYFGDGGYYIYFNAVDSIRNVSWLADYRTGLGDTIALEEENKLVKVDTLLCLMTEDSNGGAWCWLTAEESNDGEWPLAYYSLSDQKLHYKVQSFTEWLKLLVDSKGEVIRELDLEHKLGLR